MTDLSRERIAELRASRNPPTWAELMALLDAYEASRPRPASEPPEDPNDVMAYVFGEWREALYSNSQWRIYAEDGLTYDPGQKEVVAWLPLPPAPERDDA